MMSQVAVVANGTSGYGTANGGFTRVYTLVVAVRDGTNPSAVYGNATDVAITNFAYAMNAPITFSLNSTSYPSTQGYDFYTGLIADTGFQMTFDLHADIAGKTVTQPFVETLVLNNAQYVPPGNTSSFSSKDIGQATTSSASSASYSWSMFSLVCGLTMLSMVL